MRRLGKRIVAITMAAAMMTSLTPQGCVFLQRQIVYAAEQSTSVDGSGTFNFVETDSWSGEQTLDVASVSTDSVPAIGTTITSDLLIPTDGKEAAEFKGTIKSQAIIYPNGAFVAIRDWPEVKADDFKEKVTVDGTEYFKATVTYTLGDKVGANVGETWTEEVDTAEAVTEPLTKVSIKIAGGNSDYNGTIAIANTKVSVSSNDVTISSFDDYQFDKKSDWDEKAGRDNATEQSINLSTEKIPVVGTTMSVDVLLPAEEGKDAPNFEGTIKTQGVLRLGSNWTWVQSGDCLALSASDFSMKVKDKDGNEYYKAAVSYVFGEKVGANNPNRTNDAPFADVVTEPVAAVSVKIAGSNCDYNGTIALANAKLTEPEASLEEQAPTVLSDLSSEDDYKKWNEEGGWDYYHGGTENTSPKIAYDKANQRLKVSLDYSANKSVGWSEAKVKCSASEPVSIKNYNQISVDLIYQEGEPVSQIKFYAKDKETDKIEVINVYGAIDYSTAVDAGDGYKKVKITMNIKPAECTVQDITIGLIGSNTDFQGDVYLDTLTLSQKSVADDYIEITETASKTGTQADISHVPTEVKLTDPDADDSAKALYVYLQGLDASDQVLFGHQNDVSRSVSGGELGDVADVTGSVSGIFGIDSLALLGSEAGGTDAASALKNSIDYSKKAAENGAIITLSTHMPNFTNAKITKNADGTYNFYDCNFDESKDLSNDSLKLILPGGEKNDVFNAYLDTIASYALELQKNDIPVLFRPLHENTGSWFWWGSTNSVESYKSLYRYTRDYLESKGVHNMLYVYSPNGPLESEEEYLTRYPGDEYVDVLAFDYYNDYNNYPATYDASFFDNLDKTCKVISDLAKKKGKIAAISETGARVQKKVGDNEGLLVKDNPITEAKSGTNWYQKVSDIAKENNMPYYLVWANFSDTNFYVPFKYSDTLGQEMINDFIKYYNDESSVFGNGTNFYNNISDLAKVQEETYTNPIGYMVSPFDLDTILEPTTLTASVENATEVKFVVKDTATEKEVEILASKNKDGLYAADLTQSVMNEIGKTNVASITLVANGVKLATIENLSVGKEKPVAPKNVIENFEYYSGSDGLLDVSYSANSAAGCSSSFTLAKGKKNGEFAGAFQYSLKNTKTEAWTGRIKSSLTNNDFSDYNALQMWVEPDGNGQKLVVQLTDDSGEEFEVYLTDFVKGTEAQYVTIPFSSFKGKNGGTLNTADIQKFAIWCNTVADDTDISSAIYFDDIQAVNISASDIANKDDNGLIITDEAIGTTEANNGGGSSSGGSTVTTPTTPDSSNTETLPDGSTVETKTETNAAGNKVEVTTTTEKDAAGNVTGTTEEKVIADAAKNTSATVTTETGSTGDKTVTAEIVKTGTKSVAGTKGTISSSVVAQITEAAGTKDVEIKQIVVDSTGKTVYTVTVNTGDLNAGDKLKIFKYNEKTGEYILCNNKDYKVSSQGGVALTIKGNSDYKLLNQTDADKVVKKILATVKVSSSSKTVSKGKTTKITLSKKLNMANVSKITYSSTKSSVAKVDKKGKITAKKAGTATVKAKVTLKNGKTKTVTMKVKVK